MKIWLTGYKGFIGSNLNEEMRSRDHKVIGSDIDEVDADAFNGDQRNYTEVQQRYPQELGGYYRHSDVLCHQGALGSIPRSINNWPRTWAHNVDSTRRLLTEMSAAGMKKIVFASSSSVIGDSATNSPYAMSKKINELQLQTWAKVYGFQVYCIRYFNVFGPRQRIKGDNLPVIPAFCRARLREEPFPLYGDGTQTRAFTYVKDLAQFVTDRVEDLQKETSQKGFFEVINLKANMEYSVFDIMKMVNNFEGNRSMPVNEMPIRNGDRKSVGNIDDGRIVELDAKALPLNLRLTYKWYKVHRMDDIMQN